MAELELRLVRYFVAVVDHRGFTSAAAALHLSQPALSQAVRRLEGVLGAALLDRGAPGSRGGLSLTAAGEDFLPAARSLLDAEAHALRAVGVRAVRVVVGFGSDTPRDLTRAALDAGRTVGGLEVVLEHVPWGATRTALAAGALDAAFLQAPAGLDEPALRVLPLARVHRIAVFHAGHALAARDRVSMADLVDEPIVDAATDRAHWLVDPRPDGSAPRAVGPPARTVDEMLAVVSAGRGMAITSSTIAATNRSDELVFLPIDDLPGGVVHLAARRDDARAAVEALFDGLAAHVAERR